MVRETKAEALKRRKKALLMRFKGTKWEPLFLEGEWEGDPELAQKENENLEKLKEEFVKEYGDLLKKPALQWKKTVVDDGSGFMYSRNFCYETVFGNQRFRLSFSDDSRRGKCSVEYFLRRNGRWKAIGFLGDGLWRSEAERLVENQILVGEDKIFDEKHMRWYSRRKQL